jgi:anti-sigma factor RsiW
MVYDAQHALEHPEVAGWALGSLDPADVAAFGQHLQTCEQCRGEVAEFTPVAKSLVLAVPAVEPPADLALKVVAAVQYAVMAESAATSSVPEAPATTTQADVKPGTTTKAHRWWHLRWTNPLLSALAAAAVTAAAFLGATLFQPAPALAATFTLRPQPGQVGSSPAASQAAFRSRST